MHHQDSVLCSVDCLWDRSGEEQASTTGATTGWLQQLLTKVLANMSVSVSLLDAWMPPMFWMLITNAWIYEKKS